MNKLARLLLFLPLLATAGTVTPTWTFTDFGLDALSVKKMRVTPLAPYGTNGSGIITGDWRERTTDTNGSITLTNIANFYSYRVDFSGPYVKSSFTNSFGSVTGAVNAVDYISSTLITDAGLVAYSKAQANGLFLTKTNSSMIGTPTVNGTNLLSLIGSGGGSSLTLSNTTATVGVTPGGGSVGTNTVHLLPKTNGVAVGLTVTNDIIVNDSVGPARLTINDSVYRLESDAVVTGSRVDVGNSWLTISGAGVSLDWFNKTFPNGWNGSGLTNIGTSSMSAAAHAAYIGGGSFNTNVFRLTNELGHAVNVITAGVVANSLAASNANTVILSNLFNAGGTFFIPDKIYHNPIIIGTNAPRLTVLGYGADSQLNNVAATNTWGIDCRSPDSGWDGITFNYAQNIIEPVTSGETWARTDESAINAGGALRLSAVGFPKVFDCEFRDVAGTAVASITHPYIESRSNHLSVVNCRFWHNYNGIVATGTNGFEYCYIGGNIGSRNRNWSIAVNDANGRIVGNVFNGWQDSPGTGDGIVSGTGFRWRTSNGRGHMEALGNTWSHYSMSADISGRYILAGVTNDSTESFQFNHNHILGSASNFIGYFNQVQFTYNQIEAYDTNNGSIFQSISFLDATGTKWSGRIQNGSGILPFWYGRTYHNSGPHSTALGGNAGVSTNDYEYISKGGVIGATVFQNNAESGIGSFPVTREKIVAGGQFHTALLTEGFAYANGFWASNYIGFPYRAAFRPADSSYAFSITGTEMLLSSWNGPRSSLGVSNLQASGTITATGTSAFTNIVAANVTASTNVTAYISNSAHSDLTTVTGRGAWTNSSAGGVVTTTGNITSGANITAAGQVVVGSGSTLQWSSGTKISSSGGDGQLRILTSGNAANSSLTTSNMTLDGNISSARGYAMLTNAPGLTHVTNGLSYVWNSNGSVFRRTSRVAATNWQDTMIAPAP